LLRRLKYVPDRPGHDVRYDLDDHRIREDTSWAPSIDFKDGLEKTISWYLTHPDWLGWTESRVSPQYRELVYERRWGLS
jgi:dTDP-glucose 4,6-dehydratase